MKGPNLKDTTPYMAVRGLDLGGLNKTLFGPHQGVRNMFKMGLREDKSLLAMGTVAKGWEAVNINKKDKVADEI